jgi:mannitol/fructose-specific phosphotransferase system IIA component (Ntr-type)
MLSRVIRKDLICLDIKSRDKLGALKEMLDMLEGIDQSFLKIRLFQNILHREGLESTAIGHGVALPHCRTHLVDFPTVMIGWSKRGVDFGSPDGEPVHLIIMVLVPQSSNVPWLDLISDIMRVIRDELFIQAISSASTPEEVIQAVADVEQKQT